uniref:Methionine synthase n=1 Tax=Eubacterium cellulosolvens (strain ATCC 43171 / JCM 9499 / 6) TaxID=633697 RepID=I5ATD5_EUBC6
MTRSEFKELLDRGFVFLDGATGTNLQNAGMPTGVCPEQWILENREIMVQLQKDFVDAGTQILYAPTFTANRLKLGDYGLEDRLRQMNIDLVAISKEAAAGRALVAGDMTMTGRQLYPMGTMMFEELVDIYKEQAEALVAGGCDLFVIETMMSLQETRAAVLAIREICDLPIIASLTFEADGRTLFGTNPEAAMITLQSLGADVVGMNCSTGPDGMIENIEKMYSVANVPVLAKPNAGLPQIDKDGRTFYPTSPEEFAAEGRKLIEAGARVLGGCCGATPEHIRKLVEMAGTMEPKPVHTEKKRLLSSERSFVEITLDGMLQIIGERINPTGKKKLQAELREGSLDLVRDFARMQEEDGAEILDVNMGTNGIDEKEMMIKAVYEVTQVSDCPLCIDSSFPEVIEEALRIYPGRALINSISWETEKFERLIPIAKKYGAMFVFLPVSDEGIPATQEEKHAIIHAALEECRKRGIDKEDMIVDGLVATVGADPEAALHCTDTFAHCKNDLGLATVCGLSNISFGLPERSFVNMAFLVMAIKSGLTLAIANPSQELLMNAAAATDMLLAREGSDIKYITRAQKYKEAHANDPKPGSAQAAQAGGGASAGKGEGSGQGNSQTVNPVYKAVMNGEKTKIIKLCETELSLGTKPDDIISLYLIPAINDVGDLFDKQKYFLPQLIASAGTMEKAIAHLEPMIEKKEGSGPVETVVIATVEGDVHDIGKNLVALMLRNYGYRVIDLGKDVPAETIIRSALEENASVVGLSALMTTTMMRMKDVVEEAAAKGYKGKIIIGGAAVTSSFAEEIGADGYSRDAAECVQLVKKLLA